MQRTQQRQGGLPYGGGGVGEGGGVGRWDCADRADRVELPPARDSPAARGRWRQMISFRRSGDLSLIHISQGIVR